VRTREISGILGALEQGLLTIDRRGIIQAEHSRATLAIFATPEIAHRKFSSLFSDEKIQSAVDKYVEVFFAGQNISEQMLERANPLREVE
jgi:transcriptional regulator of aromatic amino acid metabolism